MQNLEDIQKLVDKKKPDFLVVLGPTAIGKTKFAINLAKKLNAEILSIDSRMVYKTMDVGTSKPTLEEMSGIKHHMIDLVLPDQKFNISDYQKLAYEKVEEIKSRGKFPMFVGGTMMYIDTICENWNLGIVEPNQDVREELEDMSTEELFKKLKELDPNHAKNIEPKNRRHIIRPLEICILTGKAYSSLPLSNEKKYSYMKIGLTMERERLYKQINERVLDQLNMGLLEETKILSKKYDYNLPSMTGLGYKQMGYYLRKEMSFEEAVDILQRDTRHFAKRQMTWWRKDEEVIGYKL